MQLRCKYCDTVQPVSTPDESDEDPRTQGIRRTFRAEHLARCGERAVFLDLSEPGTTYVDPGLWDAYLAHVQPPGDVQIGGDGFFTRPIVRDGVTHNVRVCEDCWQNIPRYVDFPAGLVSPESDGDVSVPKVRPTTVDTDSAHRALAVEHLFRVVCLPCYLAAFQRVHPAAPRPDLRADVIGDGAPVEAPAPIPTELLGRVSVSRPGREVTV